MLTVARMRGKHVSTPACPMMAGLQRRAQGFCRGILSQLQRPPGPRVCSEGLPDCRQDLTALPSMTTSMRLKLEIWGGFLKDAKLELNLRSGRAQCGVKEAAYLFECPKFMMMFMAGCMSLAAGPLPVLHEHGKGSLLSL